MMNILAIFEKGAARSATRHWLMQRVTAIVLIPLSFQLIVFLGLCMNAPYQQTVDWLKAPVNTVCIEAWLLATCYHAALGLQVVIEDYISNQWQQAVLIKAVKMGFLFLAVAALFFMFRIINP
jgi:succinate dehydrogenase / fumarate reductase, membrane anchor subunit